MTGSITRPVPTWSTTAIARLLDATRCPVCDNARVVQRRCPACGSDFDGAVGAALWQASLTAADALRARQLVLDQVPRGATAASVSPSAGNVTPDSTSAAAAAPPEAPVPLHTPGASATVQSVLAVAGAGLVAVAAVVFTFFNPDLTAALPRVLIIGGIAAGFLSGGWLLTRRGLRFSAEAVGALGAVFVGLTIAGSVPLLQTATSGWVFAGLATLIAGGALSWWGRSVGLRAWLWSGLVSLSFVPFMLAVGAGSAWGAIAGCLTSAAAASALITVTGRVAARGAVLVPERVTLTAVQLGFSAAALANLRELLSMDGGAYALSATLVLIAVLAGFSAHHPAGRLWSGIAGAATVGAVVTLPLDWTTAISFDWWFALFPAAAGAGLLIIGGVRPLHRAVHRGALFAGAVTVAAVVAIAPTMVAGLVLASAVLRPTPHETLLSPDGSLALTVGLAALGAALAGFAGLTRRDDRRGDEAAGAADEPLAHSTDVATGAAPVGTRWLAYLGAWYGVLAALTALTIPTVPLALRLSIGLGVAAAAGAAGATLRARHTPLPARAPLVVGAHAVVVLCGILSWRDPAITVPTGVAVVLVTLVLATSVAARWRFLHVGVAFAYALVSLATALTRADLDAVVVLCLTTCAAGGVALAATFVRRVPSRAWLSVLSVTAAPFAVSVLQVVFERSGWTALSTAVIFLLAFALVTTTRTGLGLVVRTLAAGVLVPALAVVAVCLGAQFLPMSGSPIVLPVIAALVAVTLPSLDLITDALSRRAPHAQAHAARIAIEASAVLSAVIAVGLSLWRDAAGLPTAFLVLVILGIGFAVAAMSTSRRYGWWLAGAAFTGALWCVWGLVGVTGLEPYLLPPALGAAGVAVLLTARGRAAAGLFAAGLAVAIVPMLVTLAVIGSDATYPARAYGLIAGAWVLLGASALISRAPSPTGRRLRRLRPPSLALAIVAAAAAAVQGVRWGWGLDELAADIPLLTASLVVGSVGAAAAGTAAWRLHAEATESSRLALTRWLGAPAVLYLTVAAWPTIERTWFAIWTMWGLCLALLLFMVAVAARRLKRPTSLPPVWFLFAVAFVTAVVAWSPRDLRVEWFSLPLGLFLLLAGALGMRQSTEPSRRPGSLADWPAGWTGSWSLMAPGLVVMLSASVAATYTDPRTWRAILVMAIALVAILVGARARLAAPFLIGIVVLPVENALAFLVQIGRGIEAMPWWITLSVVGAVLLIIAVGYERRTGEDAGIAARLRDLA